MTKVAAVKADSYDPHIVGQAITDLFTHFRRYVHVCENQNEMNVLYFA